MVPRGRGGPCTAAWRPALCCAALHGPAWLAVRCCCTLSGWAKGRRKLMLFACVRTPGKPLCF